MQDFDYLLVGGGLQNGLLAAALAEHRPTARVGVLERGSELGGNHTWCFHTADIPGEAQRFVQPFVAARWPGYAVRFPGYSRRLAEPYAAVTVASFREELTRLEHAKRLQILRGATAVVVEAERVVLASGDELRAGVVIDARGPSSSTSQSTLGFQKFLGLELEVAEGSAPREPLLMDATVPQRDGFRFLYVLPLSASRVLVEDTYYSDSPELDAPQVRDEVLGYAGRSGLQVRAVRREERGVLPLPARAPLAELPENGVICGGYQGGWFHPTTGYSFPLAARFALTVAEHPPARLRAALQLLAAEERRHQRFATLLNRMLFGGFELDQRFRVLERFYRLPASTVRRFYALRLTSLDRVRVLCGRPPQGFSLSRFLKRRQPARAPRLLPPGAA